MVKTTHVLSVLFIVSLATFGVSKRATLDPDVHPIFVTEPATLSAGSQATGTVTVNQAGTTSTVIDLTSSDTSQITVPSSVTIPAGQTQVNFTLTATSTATTEANIEAASNGSSANGRETQIAS